MPDRYLVGDPTGLVPLGIPLYVTHGSEDDVVDVSQSRSFAEAARAAGDDVVLEIVEGDDHGDPLDPSSATWQRTLAWLGARLAG